MADSPSASSPLPPPCMPCSQEMHPRCCCRGCACGCVISARWMYAAADAGHPKLGRRAAA